VDGLSGISNSHPEFNLHESAGVDPALSLTHLLGHEAILSILRAEPPDSVTILTLGPSACSTTVLLPYLLLNKLRLLVVSTVAQAIRADRKTFSRVSKVVSMGGALDAPGNTSPTAEFNFFADPCVSTARIYFAPKSENNPDLGQTL
jgi:inosine-uridine nucleoside N-ribohydrolase